MKKITFTVDGQKLEGTLFYPEKILSKNPAVLFLHGWRSSEKSAQGRAEALCAIGFICMTFNMRGNSTSEGDINTLTREDFLNDCLSAYDYLIGLENVDKEHISVIGSSFGSYLATLVAREKNIENIVLRVPANYPNDGWDQPQINFSGDNNPDILHWRFKSLGKETTYALDALSKFSGNILLIESEKDELVPHQTVENYIHAAPDTSKLTYILMKGADHAIHNEKLRAVYTNILTDWFKNKI
jgi:esterase/lipase